MKIILWICGLVIYILIGIIASVVFFIYERYSNKEFYTSGDSDVCKSLIMFWPVVLTIMLIYLPVCVIFNTIDYIFSNIDSAYDKLENSKGDIKTDNEETQI